MPTLLLTVSLLTAPPLSAAQFAHEDAYLAGDAVSGNEAFGASLALDGDRLLIGAARSHTVYVGGGAGYVFERLLDGSWAKVDVLLPPTSIPGGGGALELGWSCALEGTRALLGGVASKFAYVYEPGGSGWTIAGSLTTSGLSSLDRFGYSVALEGDRVLVGNPESDDLGLAAGAAHVFELSGAWGEVAQLYPSDVDSGMKAGAAVDLSGSWAAVGAYAKGVGSGSGAVYLFERQGDGTWVEMQRLVAPDANATHEFGRDLDLEGDRLLVGAPGFSSGDPNEGAAFLFERQAGAGWSLAQEFHASDAGQSMRFGTAVVVTGDRALIGNAPPGGSTQPGTAYLFERRADGTWGQRAMLRGSFASAADQYAHAVELDAEVAVAGAPASLAGSQGEGEVFLHDLGPLMHGAQEISLATGGLQHLILHAGDGHAGETFFVLGSIAGTSPGVPVPGTSLVLPLLADAYTQFTLATLGANPLVSPSLGSLDASGHAESALGLPAGLGPAAVGLSMHHAYVLADGLGFTLASNAVTVTLVP